MKYLKNVLFVVCIMLFITVSFSACSKSSKNDSSVNETNTSKNMIPGNDNNNAKFGKVTAIDGNQITLALFERAGFQGGSGNSPSGMPNRGDWSDGNFPSGTPNRGEWSDGNSPSGTPQRGNRQDNGDASTGTPGDAQPPDEATKGNMNNSLNETGETLDITVDDESIIKVRQNQQETDGSLKDITVDSILTINYADDGSISEIIVQSSNADANVTPAQ